MPISGLILAGGRSSRMNGDDKGLLMFQNQPLIAHVIKTLSPQVDQLLISANLHIEKYQQFGYPVLQDDYTDFRGPLAGMAKGLSFIESEYLLTVPCDGPLLPSELAQRMLEFVHEKQLMAAFVYDGEHSQPAFNLIHKTLLPQLSHALDNNEHKLGKWLRDQGALELDFSDHPDAFININTPDELESLAAQVSS